jgi:hypothetical protein
MTIIKARRNFLKGLLSVGACTALPMQTFSNLAFAGGGGSSPQLKFLFINFSDGYPKDCWHPVSIPGSDQYHPTEFSLNLVTKELEAVREYALFIDGLQLRGSAGHDGYKNIWRSENSSSLSLDVAIARNSSFNDGVPFASVNAGVSCGHWGHGASVPSRERSGQGYVRYEDDPRKLYSTLFGDDEVLMAFSGGADIDQKKTTMLESSIADLNKMKQQLGSLERAKLEAHLSALTELRQRIGNSGSGSRPDIWHPFPEGYERWNNSDIIGASGNSHKLRNDIAELQVQNLVMALAAGKTNVACLSLGTSNDNAVIDGYGNNRAPHDTSHYIASNRDDFISTRQWYLSKVSKAVAKLAELPDINGTSMLDNTLVVLTSEMSDDHCPKGVPVVLFGGKSPSGAVQQQLGLFLADNGRRLQFFDSLPSEGRWGGWNAPSGRPIGDLWQTIGRRINLDEEYSINTLSDVLL